MKINSDDDFIKKLFGSLAKKKAKTISNPPALQKMPYRPRETGKK